MTEPDSAGARPLIAALRARGFRTLFLADALVLYMAMVAINLVRFGTTWPTYPLSHYIAGFAVATGVHLVVGYFGGLYEHEPRLGQRVWLPIVAWVTAVSVLVDSLAALLANRYLMPRGNLIALAVVATLGLTGTRWLSRRLVVRRAGLPRVLLVGPDEAVELAAEHLAEDEVAEVVGRLPAGGVDLAQAAAASGASDVILLSQALLRDLYPGPLSDLEERGVGVLLRVEATETLLGLTDVREVAGMPVVPLRSHALPRSSAHLKRAFELVVLLVLAPVIALVLALTALYVRIVAGSGILLRQERVGRGGRPFSMLKFRTMVRNAEEGVGAVLAKRDDPRIIRACAWLRKTRLDEIPQVWNILRGEMSIVGPRPERVELTEEHEREIPGYARRHEVPPGITGLAQVQGRYSTDPAFKLGHDLQYLVNWSVVLDLQIMVRTIWVVLARRV